MPFTTKQSDVFYNEETKEMFVCTVSSVTALACEGADEQTLYGAVPILYKIDKDTNYKSIVYPRNLSTFDTSSASDIYGVTPTCPEGTNFTAITKPLIDYNKTKDRYIVTFLGKYTADSEGIGVSNFVFQNIDTNFYLLDAKIYIPKDKFTSNLYTFDNGRLNSDFIVGGNTVRNDNPSYFSDFERSPEYLIPPTHSDNTSFLSGSDSLGFNLMLFHTNTDTDTLTGNKQFPMMYSGGHIGYNPKYTAFDPEHSIRVDFRARCFNVPAMTAFYSTQSTGVSASRWVENCDSPTGFGEGFCVYFYENPTIGGYVIPNGTNTTLGYAKADYTLVEKAGTAQAVEGLYIHRRQIGTIIVPMPTTPGHDYLQESSAGFVTAEFPSGTELRKRRDEELRQRRTPIQKDREFWHPSFAGGVIGKPDTSLNLEAVPTKNLPAPRSYESYFGSIQSPIEPANSFLGIGFDVRGQFCTTLEGKSGWYKEDIGAYGGKTVPATLDGYTFTNAPCSVGIRGSSFHDTEVLSCIPLSGVPSAKTVPMHTNCAQANASDAPFVDYRIDLTNKGTMVTISNKLSTETDYNTIAEFRLNSVSHATTKYDPWKGFSLTDDNRLKPLNVGLSFTSSDYCSYFELKSFEATGVKINDPWAETLPLEGRDETKQLVNALHQSSKMIREKLVKVETEDKVDLELVIPAKGRLAREVYEKSLDKDVTLCDDPIDVPEYNVEVKLTGLTPEEIDIGKIERGEQGPHTQIVEILDGPEPDDPDPGVDDNWTPWMHTVPCPADIDYHGSIDFPKAISVTLGTGLGLVWFKLLAWTRPDRMQVFLGNPKYDARGYPQNLVIDTGFIGGKHWADTTHHVAGKTQPHLKDALAGEKGFLWAYPSSAEVGWESTVLGDSIWPKEALDTISRDDILDADALGLGEPSTYCAFEKKEREPNAVILIWAPVPGTAWHLWSGCPEQPIGKDQDGNIIAFNDAEVHEPDAGIINTITHTKKEVDDDGKETTTTWTENVYRTQADMDDNVLKYGGQGQAWQPKGVNAKNGLNWLIDQNGRAITEGYTGP